MNVTTSAATKSIGSQQVERVDTDPLGDPLYRLQGEVPFTALNAAHVGAVVAELVGETFLAESVCFAVAAQVASKSPL